MCQAPQLVATCWLKGCLAQSPGRYWPSAWAIAQNLSPGRQSEKLHPSEGPGYNHHHGSPCTSTLHPHTITSLYHLLHPRWLVPGPGRRRWRPREGKALAKVLQWSQKQAVRGQSLAFLSSPLLNPRLGPPGRRHIMSSRGGDRGTGGQGLRSLNLSHADSRG